MNYLLNCLFLLSNCSKLSIDRQFFFFMLRHDELDLSLKLFDGIDQLSDFLFEFISLIIMLSNDPLFLLFHLFDQIFQFMFIVFLQLFRTTVGLL